MKIYWLLVLVPAAIGAALLGVNPSLVFVLSFFGMIPLAALLSEAVDQLALYTGPSVGALLTATFGTVTEIFILLNLLRQGQFSVMQAEVTGSVLLGLLLVVGLSEVLGGIKHGFQEFDSRATALATSLMALAVVGMLIPTFFRSPNSLAPANPSHRASTTPRSIHSAAAFPSHFSFCMCSTCSSSIATPRSGPAFVDAKPSQRRNPSGVAGVRSVY